MSSEFAESFIKIRADRAEFVSSMHEIGEVAKQKMESLKDALTALNPLGGVLSGLSMAGLFEGMRELGGESATLDQHLTALSFKFAEVGGSSQAAKKELAELVDSLAGPVFTARQATDALDVLASRGFKRVTDAASLMPSIMTLASAGNVELADSAQTVTSIMRQFHLSIADAPALVDKLTNAANASGIGIKALGDSFYSVGQVAGGMGVKLDVVLGMISAMSRQGIDAGDAGMALSRAMSVVSEGSEELRKTLGGLGVSFSTIQKANGSIDFVKLIRELQRVRAGGDDINKVFGPRMGKAFIALFSSMDAGGHRGMDAVDGLVKSFAKSGSAAEQAATMLATPKKQIELLGNAVVMLKESIGAGLMSSLGKMAAAATAAVRGITSFNEEHGNLLAKLLKGAAIVATVTTSVYALGYGFKFVGGAISGISKSTIILWAIEAAVVAGIYAWEKWGDQIKAAFAALDERYGIVAKATAAMSYLSSVATAAWDAIQSAAVTAWGYISSAATAAASTVYDALTSAWASTKPVLLELAQYVIDIYWNIADAVAPVVKGIVAGFEWAANAAASAFKWLYDSITGMTGPAFTWLKDNVVGWVTGVIDLFSLLTTNMAGGWEVAKNSALSSMEAVYQGLLKTIKMMLDASAAAFVTLTRPAEVATQGIAKVFGKAYAEQAALHDDFLSKQIDASQKRQQADNAAVSTGIDDLSKQRDQKRKERGDQVNDWLGSALALARPKFDLATGGPGKEKQGDTKPPAAPGGYEEGGGRGYGKLESLGIDKLYGRIQDSLTGGKDMSSEQTAKNTGRATELLGTLVEQGKASPAGGSSRGGGGLAP
jgi:TP901 family phage tail tape measure protein